MITELKLNAYHGVCAHFPFWDGEQKKSVVLLCQTAEDIVIVAKLINPNINIVPEYNRRAFIISDKALPQMSEEPNIQTP